MREIERETSIKLSNDEAGVFAQVMAQPDDRPIENGCASRCAIPHNIE
jgi:hypothetical protein